MNQQTNWGQSLGPGCDALSSSPTAWLLPDCHVWAPGPWVCANPPAKDNRRAKLSYSVFFKVNNHIAHRQRAGGGEDRQHNHLSEREIELRRKIFQHCWGITAQQVLPLCNCPKAGAKAPHKMIKIISSSSSSKTRDKPKFLTTARWSLGWEMNL